MIEAKPEPKDWWFAYSTNWDNCDICLTLKQTYEFHAERFANGEFAGLWIQFICAECGEKEGYGNAK